MSLRIRRGTDLQRQTIIFDHGELLYTTDIKQLFIGDGATTGGTHVLSTTAGLGLTWNNTTQKLDISGSNLTTNEVTETTNFYFTAQRAKDAAAALFTHNDGMSNIAFTYDQLGGKINAVVTLDGVGLISVSQDTNPHLGGNLVLSGHNITGTGGINVTGNITGTTLSGILGADLGLNSYNITGAGNISIAGDIVTVGHITGTTLSGNLSASLAADLGLNSHNITGTGNISITGDIIASTTIIASTSLNSPTYIVGPGGINPIDAGSSIVFNASTAAISVYGVTSTGLAQGAFVKNFQSRGTLASPTTLQPGDYLTGMIASGYNGLTYVPSGFYGITQDAAISFSSSSAFIPGDFRVSLWNSSSVPTALQSLIFNSAGTLYAPQMQVGSHATGAYPSPPAIGMIIFDSTLGHFFGFNGTTWAPFTGP